MLCLQSKSGRAGSTFVEIELQPAVELWNSYLPFTMALYLFKVANIGNVTNFILKLNNSIVR